MRDLLARLRLRSGTVSLAGRTVHIVDVKPKNAFGLFLHRKNEIQLAPGRPDRETLFTLCHELGHFRAHARSRRTVDYDRALYTYQQWVADLECKVRNSGAFLSIKSGDPVPAETRKMVWEREKAKKPNPLSPAERAEILGEETRAWCFGFALVSELGGIASGAFVSEADSALRIYSEDLNLPINRWLPSPCVCGLDDIDKSYILGLIRFRGHPTKGGYRGKNGKPDEDTTGQAQLQ